MKKKLAALSIIALALCACESSFSEPEYPLETTETSGSVLPDDETRNDDDSSAARAVTIVIEDENDVDIEFSV